MKPEALDAFATQTVRPGALEAAITKAPEKDGVQTPEENMTPSKAKKIEKEDVRGTIHSISCPDTHVPQPLHTSPSPNLSATKVVEDVVHGVQAGVQKVVHSAQAVVQDVVAWTEKKAEELSVEADRAGPYTSPATCVPSDFDPIASGVLPAMAKAEEDMSEDGGQVQEKEKGSGGESKL